ncbi:riboflavin synthase subunit beta [Tenacibaculum sp. UWU-22]|uniref:riboflavin synthase subunit beta n=1 Tax=Tenacibaculum sp. UWU-22 TaxID=3234187 RepID=UPI0034DB2F47
MAFFKREPKKFDYKPRYYKGEGNPYKITYKFDQYRSTVGKNKNLKSKLSQAYSELLEIRKTGVNKTILIIVIVLVLLFLYIIDFELSIFLPQS